MKFYWPDSVLCRLSCMYAVTNEVDLKNTQFFVYKTDIKQKNFSVKYRTHKHSCELMILVV